MSSMYGISVRIYVSVREGCAVLCCHHHPDWLPRIMGDQLSPIHEKIKAHLEEWHDLTLKNADSEIVRFIRPGSETGPY